MDIRYKEGEIMEEIGRSTGLVHVRSYHMDTLNFNNSCVSILTWDTLKPVPSEEIERLSKMWFIEPCEIQTQQEIDSFDETEPSPHPLLEPGDVDKVIHVYLQARFNVDGKVVKKSTHRFIFKTDHNWMIMNTIVPCPIQLPK